MPAQIGSVTVPTESFALCECGSRQIDVTVGFDAGQIEQVEGEPYLTVTARGGLLRCRLCGDSQYVDFGEF